MKLMQSSEPFLSAFHGGASGGVGDAVPHGLRREVGRPCVGLQVEGDPMHFQLGDFEPSLPPPPFPHTTSPGLLVANKGGSQRLGPC